MTRRQHLEHLLTRVQHELAAELAREARIAAIAATVEIPDDEPADIATEREIRRGRPRNDVWSRDEARQAHAMFAAGNREEWVVQAERQYQRDRKRESRKRLGQVAG